MALTNFAALTTEQKTAWARDVWKIARNKSFANSFSGGQNAMITRVDELTEDEKGARAVLTLVSDAEGDGVVGDNTLEGNEEALRSYDQVIQIDQFRHAHRSQGRMAEQKSIVKFRKEARDTLGYWLSDRWDQLAFLTLAGMAYTLKPDGSTRVGSQFSNLSFASDVTAPSTNRYVRWDAGTTSLIKSGASNADLVAADTPTWKMLVDLKAYAVEQHIRPISSDNGIEHYNVFMTPRGIAGLIKDPDFLAIVREAGVRGESNQLFKGTAHGSNGFFVNGLRIMEYRYVPNTLGASSGSKWGAGGAVDGQRVLLCGAQALGFADIGSPKWVEKDFDYDNQQGIAIGKIAGFKKPVFRTPVTGTNEDFGVIVCDTAI
jgi:N4-gp56 family major capsid protein